MKLKNIKHDINIGGIWEEDYFEIIENYEDKSKDEHCKHYKDGIISYVVVAYNEGGYDNTGVCAECIVEALDKIKNKEKGND